MKVIFDMIALVVLIILILFAVYLIFTFLTYTSLILNLIILIALYFLITRDLKDKDNHKYYLVALFLTALLFILSNTGTIGNFLILADKLYVSTVIVSVIAVYVFANIIAFIYESYQYLKKKYLK